MENNSIKTVINISRDLNEIALSLINISNFYKKNLSHTEVISLLDETLKNQLKDTSLIILNTFKYMIALKDNNFLNNKLNEEDIADKLNNFIILKKDTKFETLAYIIIEIIFLINDSIYSESSKEVYLNFVKSFSKLYIFEKQNLETNLLKEITKEILNLENL